MELFLVKLSADLPPYSEDSKELTLRAMLGEPGH